jgi:hypothetical protein
MDDFNPFEFIRNLFVALAIGIICVLAYYLYQSNINSFISSGVMNITTWNPSVAQIPTVIAPLAILGSCIFLIFVVFFRKKIQENPYYIQARQQYQAQQMLQRDIQRQQYRRKPRTPKSGMRFNG